MNQSESNITKLFFESLGQRRRKENDLSDVTWAMCMASETFRTEFLAFFFGDVDFADAEIVRESAEGDSRPDFRIDTPNGFYLIEVKIYDANHHFEQYVDTFGISPKKLGYITNYAYSKTGFTVHQWQELVDYLEERIPADEEDMWNGYLAYVKKVCNLTVYTKPMNLNGLYTICELNRALSEVCDYSADNYHTSLNSLQKKYQQGEFGVYFDLEFRKGNKGKFTRGGGEFVVKFDIEEPVLMIYFTNTTDWHGPLYSKLTGNVSSMRETKLCNKPYDDGSYIVFEFAATEEFEKSETYEEQKALLGKFFREVIDRIYKTALAKN